MKLISRSILREIWPPFLLGFVAYTFLLLIRQIFFLTDFLVRRAAGAPEVLWLIVLSIPLPQETPLSSSPLKPLPSPPSSLPK